VKSPISTTPVSNSVRSEPVKKSLVSLGRGLSSAAGGEESLPVSIRCLIPGFPANSKRFLDGSVAYSCMDDTGGSWTFLGAKDQVCVTWKVYDSVLAEFENGDQVFVNVTHFNQVVRTLRNKYHYSFEVTERDERLDFSRGGDMADLKVSTSPRAPGRTAAVQDSPRASSRRRSVSVTPETPRKEDFTLCKQGAPDRGDSSTQASGHPLRAPAAGDSRPRSPIRSPTPPRPSDRDPQTLRAPVSHRDDRRSSRTRETDRQRAQADWDRRWRQDNLQRQSILPDPYRRGDHYHDAPELHFSRRSPHYSSDPRYREPERVHRSRSREDPRNRPVRILSSPVRRTRSKSPIIEQFEDLEQPDEEPIIEDYDSDGCLIMRKSSTANIKSVVIVDSRGRKSSTSEDDISWQRGRSPKRRKVTPKVTLLEPETVLCEGDSEFGCMRSEERRVGKECRSRWSPYH
jgi:hypothetical protein